MMLTRWYATIALVFQGVFFDFARGLAKALA
jgi:hypothetical protein